MFVVPASLHQLVKAVDRPGEAAILPFQRRAEAALAPRSKGKQETKPLFEEKQMRTADTMDAARAGLGESFDRIRSFLPAGAVKEEFERRASSILEKAQVATEVQVRFERTPGDIEGERYVDPNPAKIFRRSLRMSVKARRFTTADTTPRPGADRTLAFIDKGKTLDVRDWNNAESVNAALQVASQKWDSLTINGSDAYKETVARLAAEHGLQVANPELQDRIREIQAEAEARRQSLAERKDQAEQQQTEAKDTTPKAQPEFEGERRETADGPILNRTPPNDASNSKAFVSASLTKPNAKPSKPSALRQPTRLTPPVAAKRPPIARKTRPASRARPSARSKTARRAPFHPIRTNPRPFRPWSTRQQRVFNQEERDQQRQSISKTKHGFTARKSNVSAASKRPRVNRCDASPKRMTRTS